MRFYLRLRDNRTNQHLDGIVSAILGSGLGWQVAGGGDFHKVVGEMAQRLPDQDLEQFLSSVKVCLVTTRTNAGLTINQIVGEISYVFVRIYAPEQREAILPAVGLRLASLLVQLDDDLIFDDMIVWQQRNRAAVLVGSITDRVPWRRVATVSPTLAALAVISGLLGLVLFGGALVEDQTGHTVVILQSGFLDWFKRLIGPIGSTFAASVVGLYIESRNYRMRRVSWDIDVDGP